MLAEATQGKAFSMHNTLVAATIVLGSLGLASVQASPVAPAGMTPAVEQLGGVEAVHCTPGKRHHIPTWNYRADGCKRPSRKVPAKKAPAKDAPPAKSSYLQM
jgi:hypothetical protein